MLTSTRPVLLLAALLLALTALAASPARARTPEYRVYFPRVLASERTWPRGAAAGAWGQHRDTFCDDMKSQHVAWWYDWGRDNASACPGTEYVPMIWGRDDVTRTLTGNSAWLLAFNEPNLAGQADMTPEEAAALWPYLEATGRKLVSPAVYWGYGRTGDDWLERFMAACAGCRVDAIGLHWYGCDVNELHAYLDLRQAQYPGKPLWLTEWGCKGNEAAFAAEALPAIEAYTARNAPWALYQYGDWLPLVDASGALTGYGEIYAGGMP